MQPGCASSFLVRSGTLALLGACSVAPGVALCSHAGVMWQVENMTKKHHVRCWMHMHAYLTCATLCVQHQYRAGHGRSSLQPCYFIQLVPAQSALPSVDAGSEARW